uniref:Uncharacterized protein n=1 Tax=Tanacetum cinerariifolium TaxID=118510 RepID=A0A6L2KLF3_TANCI|nr:hypothetical protein [Tanacetum cinerariifolium]
MTKKDSLEDVKAIVKKMMTPRGMKFVSWHTTQIRFNFRRTSLTGFPAQIIRSSNAIALDSLYLLVLITRTSQSRQHDREDVNFSLFRINGHKETFSFLWSSSLVKEKQEKDKIGTKPDKNEKRRKARQCKSPVTVKKVEKEKKYRVKGPILANPESCINSRTNTRADIVIHSKINHKGQNRQTCKAVIYKDQG